MSDKDFFMRVQEDFEKMDEVIDEICQALFPPYPIPQAIGKVEPIIQTKSYAPNEEDECLDYEIYARRHLDLNVLKLWRIPEYCLFFKQSFLRLGNYYGGFGTDFIDNRWEMRTIGEMTFQDCTFGEICIHLCTFKKLIFQNCVFQKRASFAKCIFEEIVFQNCIFEDEVIITESHFKGTAKFECSFKKEVNFSDCIFGEIGIKNSRVYFDRSIFCKAPFFARARFYGEITSFYKVIFEQIPNFTQALFQTNLNLVNTYLNFDYDVTFEIIKGRNCQNNFSIVQQKANDFRDSFRIFKNTLSKEGNILDASNYHRVELYCKEIELDSKVSKLFSRDWIDKWQLCFYRHTSDHHTDLFKIVSWIIVAIGFFGLSLLGCRYGLDFEKFLVKYSQNIYVSFFNVDWIVQSKVICLVYWVGFWSLFWKQARIIFFSFVVLSMCLISFKSILGVAKLLGSERVSVSPLENLLIVLYAIIMIVLLFSLQKTARKNSIAPN